MSWFVSDMASMAPGESHGPAMLTTKTRILALSRAWFGGQPKSKNN
jgi:hypothetical protein